MDDLFQVGCIGLIKSAENFDVSLGLQFSTYGVPMILGEIRRYLRDNNMVRVSRAMRDTAYKALAVREKLMSENSKEPTAEDIAKVLELPKEDVVMALESIVDPVSLFEPVYSEGSDAIYVMDQISDEKVLDESLIDSIALYDALKRLNEKERKIVSMRFFSEKTQMEVASEIGISQAQVSRLEKNAIEHMRKFI